MGRSSIGRTMIKACGWLPIIVITCILIWSYYAYVVQLCIYTLTSTVLQVILGSVFNLLFFLLAWSFYHTVFSKVGHPPLQFYLPNRVLDEISTNLSEERRKKIIADFAITTRIPIATRSLDGSIRFCDNCKVVKPDRAHHCSICDSCNLKMDHHCPWVNTCVNYNNYKFFVLFLGYATFFCLFVLFSDLKYAIDAWKFGMLKNNVIINGADVASWLIHAYAALTGFQDDGSISEKKIHLVLLPFIALIFAGSAGCLFIYHLWLMAKNQTTIEQGMSPIFASGRVRPDGYNLGVLKNFKEVFGDSYFLWLFPVFTSLGDGIRFSSRFQSAPPSENGHVEVEIENGITNGYQSSTSVPDSTSYKPPRRHNDALTKV